MGRKNCFLFPNRTSLKILSQKTLVQEHGRIVHTVWLLSRKGNWQIRTHERVEVWAVGQMGSMMPGCVGMKVRGHSIRFNSG